MANHEAIVKTRQAYRELVELHGTDDCSEQDINIAVADLAKAIAQDDAAEYILYNLLLTRDCREYALKVTSWFV